MNAPVIPASVNPEPNVVYFVGRVEHVSKYQDSFTTLIKTPGLDRYSHPSTMALRSKKRLGALGDDVSVYCLSGGVPRSFKRVDKETGEETMVRTADHYFNVIES